MPLLWALDLVMALPRFVLLHVVFALIHVLVWRPCSWMVGLLSELADNSIIFLLRYIVSQPTGMLSQIPVTNPMVVAVVLSVLVAAFSAPQPPSLSLPALWSSLPSLKVADRLRQSATGSGTFGPLLRRFWTLWALRKEGRSKGGARLSAPRGQKDRPHYERCRESVELSNHSDRAQWGGLREERVLGCCNSSKNSAPPCFVCLDSPSHYILEPCGHRVVCGDCAVQLVEAAARTRSTGDLSGGHHVSEKSGGTCPSCGLAIARAMRIFA